MDEGCHGGPGVHDTDRIARRNASVIRFCDDVAVFLMRVTLPDRPGSLGAVATAMGGVGGDINAVEIVEKGSGVVVDDFIVDLPPNQLPETIVTACQTLEGVRVEWIARYPEGGGLQSDLEALERMTADPVARGGDAGLAVPGGVPLALGDPHRDRARRSGDDVLDHARAGRDP